MNYRDFKNYYNLDENAARAVTTFITKLNKNRKKRNEEVNKILSQPTTPVIVSAHPEHPRSTLARMGIRENYDVYDVIVSHLLDEGYASSAKGAELIAMNMSEGWMHSIVEAQQRLFDAPPTTHIRAMSKDPKALMPPGMRILARSDEHEKNLPPNDPRRTRQRKRARVTSAAYASARYPR